MAYKPKQREAIQAEICARIIGGESVRKICEDKHMPDRVTLLNWLEADATFSSRYARAREAQADHMDDLILETAANATNEDAQVARVRILAYQWRASKLKPKKYGEKIQQEHTGADGAPLQVVIQKLSDE